MVRGARIALFACLLALPYSESAGARAVAPSVPEIAQFLNAASGYVETVIDDMRVFSKSPLVGTIVRDTGRLAYCFDRRTGLFLRTREESDLLVTAVHEHYRACDTCRVWITPVDSLPSQVPTTRPPQIDELLASDRPFNDRVIGDLRVLWRDRMIGGVRVQGDFEKYLFGGNTGVFLGGIVRWREDLPNTLPTGLLTKTQAEAIAFQATKKTPRRSYMLYNASGSSVFPVDLPTDHPCWIVYVDDEAHVIPIIDALSGKVLGYGTPVP
jgi:hypothetical protein